jgi:hypothetical protein
LTGESLTAEFAEKQRGGRGEAPITIFVSALSKLSSRSLRPCSAIFAVKGFFGIYNFGVHNFASGLASQQGKMENFILLVEGSIPNELN